MCSASAPCLFSLQMMKPAVRARASDLVAGPRRKEATGLLGWIASLDYDL